MIYAKGRKFILDDESDIENLPTGRSPGTVAKILSNSAIYKTNSNGEWMEWAAGGSSGSNGGYYISKVELDEDNNLILTYNTDALTSLTVSLDDMFADEFADIYSAIDAITLEEADEATINNLFAEEGE